MIYKNVFAFMNPVILISKHDTNLHHSSSIVADKRLYILWISHFL